MKHVLCAGFWFLMLNKFVWRLIRNTLTNKRSVLFTSFINHQSWRFQLKHTLTIQFVFWWFCWILSQMCCIRIWDYLSLWIRLIMRTIRSTNLISFDKLFMQSNALFKTNFVKVHSLKFCKITFPTSMFFAIINFYRFLLFFYLNLMHIALLESTNAKFNRTNPIFI